ncbi:YhcH/YjgK/YiaL family protein [Clostridium phoceensis]|uniref:YhcH/YjgK/YiaL family protein n=1 Tax=Clostridium phoceensis TaxID=1650661 RepID=UPI00067EEAC3|nr:YhcH/YjgK/YiaL family protein [Clostridium phoceensis]
MIFTHRNDCDRYQGITPNLDVALRFIQATDLDALEPGKHSISGQDVWVRISDVTTKPEEEAVLEAHRDFLDIQMVLRGEEIIRCGFLGQMTHVTDTCPDRDVSFYSGPSQPITLTDGQLLILFPDDVHAPALAKGKPSVVRKALFKVRL